MKRLLSICLAILLALGLGIVALPPQAATADPGDIYVPGDYPTIQAGINAASAGDTVQVAAGTYYENITLEDGVEVLGAGAGVTTIDGGGSGSVVTANNVGPTTTLDGFTITNGNATYGGGMYNDNSSPTVTNCTFSGNLADYNGGGMFNYDNSSPAVSNCVFTGNTAGIGGGGMGNELFSSPAVTNCTFSGNSAAYGGGMGNGSNSSPAVTNCTFSGNSAEYGGGMYNHYSSPTVTNCTFSGNLADYNGGGMYNQDSSPAVTNCTFETNTAGYYGGGMFNFTNSSPRVTNCAFSGNLAVYGGGMFNYTNSSPTVTNCTFSGNLADYNGGGMFNYDNSSPTVSNCVFTGNTAGTGGGGMGNESFSSPAVTNCTFSGNSAVYGGGMGNGSNSSPAVTNCTFSGNSAAYGGGMYNDYSSPTVTNCIFWDNGDEIYNSSSTPVVTYCDVQGGYSGTGNIDADPLFVGGGDFHLQPGSPCIDAGDNTAPSLPATDFEGDPRIVDGDYNGTATVDMGVDEYYVSVDIDPDTLNLKSKGKWITCYIELPAGHDVADINITTVLLNDSVPAVTDPKYDFVTDPSEYITDNDGDGILERMVKFDRSEVQAILTAGDAVEITVTGQVAGTPFEGSDIIRVK